jgi:hypothetical protein
MNIKRLTQEYYEQLYVHTFDRLDKIEQFHKRHYSNSQARNTQWEHISNKGIEG